MVAIIVGNSNLLKMWISQERNNVSMRPNNKKTKYDHIGTHTDSRYILIQGILIKILDVLIGIDQQLKKVVGQ